MKRRVTTKAWISEIEVYDRLDGHTLAMQCLTRELKPFEVTLVFHPRAPCTGKTASDLRAVIVDLARCRNATQTCRQ